MKDIRSDYKISRNKKIYEDHMKKGLSYNKIGDKYKLSPQRVQKIINDFESKNLTYDLSPSDSVSKREEQKATAELLREKGKFEASLDLFNKVIAWDEKNDNPRGLVDVLGHIRILHTRQALMEEKDAKKKEYLDLAYEVVKKAEKVIKDFEKNPRICLDGTKYVYKNMGTGTKPILMIHKSSVLIDLALLKSGNEKTKDLKKALKTINSAIKILPGSQAHKAWPMRQKAEILTLLNKNDEALKTIQEAEFNLYEGYEEEMKDPSGELKINVWKSGLDITLAKLYISQKRIILAKQILTGVVNIVDPKKLLVERKKEAKALLSKL